MIYVFVPTLGFFEGFEDEKNYDVGRSSCNYINMLKAELDERFGAIDFSIQIGYRDELVIGEDTTIDNQFILDAFPDFECELRGFLEEINDDIYSNRFDEWAVLKTCNFDNGGCA